MTRQEHTGGQGAATPPAAGERLPLSAGQEAMWVSWKTDPEQWTHIIPTPFLVRGELDTARLAGAVTRLGEHWPTLRGRVVRDAGRTWLTWTDAPDITVTEHTCELPRAEAVRAVWQRPFDLDAGPLARVDVLRGDGWTVLLIAVHHLVYDGASILLLLAGLRRAYAGEPLEGVQDLDALARFAERSHALADGPEGEEPRDFWRRRLGTDVPALQLPAGHEPPGTHVHRAELDPALSAAVDRCAAELGVSRFTVLFGAYFVLLRRFTGQDDLLVSAPYHGRAAPDLAGQVGFFVNALPIRLRLTGDDDHASFLRRLRGEMRSCQRHGDLPLPAILNAARLSGWSGHSRTHQAVFQFWDASRAADVDVKALTLGTGDGACTLRLLDMESSADYTLTTMVREDGDRTSVLFKDPRGVVGPRLLAAMADDYARTLADIVAHPEHTLAQASTGRTPAAASRESLPEAETFVPFARRVSDAGADPDRVALVTGAGDLTYRALDLKAAALAARLTAEGVQREDLVAVLAPRTPGLATAVTAVLRAGAAFALLDPAWSEDTVRTVLRESRPYLVLTTAEYAPRVADGQVLLLDEEHAEAPMADAPAKTEPGDLACVLFAEDGVGPGIALAQSHLDLLCDWAADAFPARERDGVSARHGAGTPALLSLLLPLGTGGSVLMDDRPGTGASTGLLVTDTAGAHDLVTDRAALAGLRALAVHGPRLPAPVLRALHESAPHLRVHHLYGHRATALVAFHRLHRAGDRPGLGTPVGGATVRVLDRDGAPVPEGAPGRLHVAGPLVARGHWRRPAADPAVFVTGPGGAREAVTGDLVRYLPDGLLEHLGTEDERVETGAGPAYPGAVAALFEEHPAVARAEVRATGAPGAARLTVHVTPAGPDRAAETLRRELLAHAGKSASWAARDTEIEIALPGRADATGAPAGPGLVHPVFTALAAIWSEVLGGVTPQADDDFFELGGHSLLAGTLLEKVADRFGVEIELRGLFEFSGFADFVDLVRAQLPEEPGEVRDGAPAGSFPASGFQERIWFAERLDPGTALYHVPFAWEVEGRLDPALLERALGLLVERHEILRTRFVEHDGRLLDVVGEPWAPVLERADLTTTAPAERRGHLEEWIRQAARQPFDVSSGRLLRASLADLGDHHVLFLCFHHLVFDGESTPVLLRRLGEFYAEAGGEAGRHTPQGAPARTLPDTARDGGPDPLPTPLGTEVAALWSEVLDTGRSPRAEDSFFRSGGTSLTVARLVRRLNDRLGCGLSLRDLFEHQRFGELLRLVADRGGRLPQDGGDSTGPALTDTQLASSFPASGFQERIWLAERLEPDSALYNIPLGWEVEGRLDPALLERALGLLVERHEILRTRFVEHDGRLLDVVGEPWAPVLERADLTTATPAERRGHLEEWIRQAARQPFDVSSGRLLRASLADLGDHHVLFLCFHHLVLDGDSAPVLVGELRDCYDLAAGRRAADTLPEVTQYRHYAEADRRAREETDDAALDYWADRLKGAPSTLPDESPEEPEPHGAVPIPLAPDLLDGLRDVMGAYKVSWFMIVATALAAVLHERTGRDDVTFGTPVSDRRRGHSRIVGPQVNTVILRSQTGDGTVLADLLREMRTTVLDALHHQRAPFEAVIERLAPPRDPARTPYADVTLNMNVKPPQWPALDGRRLDPVLVDSRWEHEVKFGLTVTVQLVGDSLQAALSYRGDRRRRADAEQLAGALAQLLNDFPARLDRPVATPAPAGPAQVPPAYPQYRDFVRAGSGSGDGSGDESGDGGLGFWQRYLRDAPAYLPVPAPDAPGAHGAVDVPVAAGTLPRLRELQESHGVTLYMVGAAALATMLFRWTGLDDIVFGTPVSTREEGFEDLIGPCLNTVVIRCRRGRGTTPTAVLRQVRECVLGAFEHQRTPFEAVVDALNPPRRPGWVPYIDVTLTMESRAGDARLGGRALTRIDAGQGHDTLGKYGLALGLVESPDGLRATVTHRGDRLSARDAGEFARGVGKVLDAFASAPETSLDTLDLGGFATAPDTTAPAAAGEAVAPVVIAGATAAELERRIGDLWCEVLSRPAVGRTENFFDLGGNSTLLSTLHHRLRTALHTDLPVRHLFQFPTVASLAAALAGTLEPGPDSAGDAFRLRAERARLSRPVRVRREGDGR